MQMSLVKIAHTCGKGAYLLDFKELFVGPCEKFAYALLSLAYHHTLYSGLHAPH